MEIVFVHNGYHSILNRILDLIVLPLSWKMVDAYWVLYVSIPKALNHYKKRSSVNPKAKEIVNVLLKVGAIIIHRIFFTS